LVLSFLGGLNFIIPCSDTVHRQSNLLFKWA
jgi:hypothetical protein